MDDETMASVKDALVREAIALGALFTLLWILGPGKVLVPAWIARARAKLAGSDPYEGQVRAFAREVSEYDHEQATQSHRKAAGGGPCGCGGLRSPRGHRPDPPRDAPCPDPL